MDNNQVLVTEWKDIRDSLRYFGNKRFAQLTVFVAATGFMFDAFLKQADFTATILLAIVGVLLSALFGIMEWRSVQYWDKFVERAEAIETKVEDLELMTKYRPHNKSWITGTNATYAIYVGGGVLWLATLVVQSLFV